MPNRTARSTQPPSIIDSQRCKWARNDELLANYHDTEWGRPILTDDGHLERMALEIFQCGLSWRIVLVKRPALRAAFREFRLPRVAAMGKPDVLRLMADAGIIRNRLKIEATIENARRMIDMAGQFGSFRTWLDGQDVATPRQRQALMKEFKQRFRFMGPETTKCYLWGVGKVIPPHEKCCWMHTPGGARGAAF